jgi:hypothetical protein
MLIPLQERQLSLNHDGRFRNARLERPGEHLGVLLRHLGGVMLFPTRIAGHALATILSVIGVG